jgi:uncharacterized surface protein with fasciclin (FAS1) repeats
MTKSSKHIIKGFILTLALICGSTAIAQVEGVTIPRAAAAVNSSGPYAGLFDELIQALYSDQAYLRPASVMNVLGRKGPFTVFAPTDGAFQALKQTLTCNGIAMSDIPDIVRTVLAYHGAAGMLMAEDVLATPEVMTLAGATFSQDGGVITDQAGQQANILITDLVVDNGVIHVIDTVLLPADLGLAACP